MVFHGSRGVTMEIMKKKQGKVQSWQVSTGVLCVEGFG